MMMAASNPKTMAPIKKSTPKMKERATPGKTACEIASPMSDIPRRMMKHPTAPATTPTTIAVIKAFCKKWNFCNPSINSAIIGHLH